MLRVLREAAAAGAVAINYVSAEALLRENGRVAGLSLRDRMSGRTHEARARVVINATGAWADRLRRSLGGMDRLRPLRGSHLIFPGWRLPLAQAITCMHPWDGRPLCLMPWEGASLVGTTDLDHDEPLDDEPAISPEEVGYLLAAAHAQFPSLALGPEDVTASFAGIRP